MIKLFSTDHAAAPRNQVILEDALVKLVKDVRGKAGKYIGMWQFHPKWVINSTESQFLEFGSQVSLLFSSVFLLLQKHHRLVLVSPKGL
jgi:hypothetical protein